MVESEGGGGGCATTNFVRGTTSPRNSPESFNFVLLFFRLMDHSKDLINPFRPQLLIRQRMMIYQKVIEPNQLTIMTRCICNTNPQFNKTFCL